MRLLWLRGLRVRAGWLRCRRQTAEKPVAAEDDLAATGIEVEGATASATEDIWKIAELGEPTETITADICIVGAGGTGTAAAIQAADMGLTAVVIERLAGYGGSFIGTEGMTGLRPGTPLARTALCSLAL